MREILKITIGHCRKRFLSALHVLIEALLLSVDSIYDN